MENIEELVQNLCLNDNTLAYRALKQLEAESAKTNAVYTYFEQFVSMMDSSNSYIRTRGLTLICANARWDTENRIDKIIDSYLSHITDEKPITARQCIKSLPEIAKYKPHFAQRIYSALQTADLSNYRQDTMLPLIIKDISLAQKKISKLK